MFDMGARRYYIRRMGKTHEQKKFDGCIRRVSRILTTLTPGARGALEEVAYQAKRAVDDAEQWIRFLDDQDAARATCVAKRTEIVNTLAACKAAVSQQRAQLIQDLEIDDIDARRASRREIERNF